MAHQDIGLALMLRVAKDLEEYGAVELQPKPEGRQITMVLAPNKKK
jgi:translation initiation factor IF-3